LWVLAERSSNQIPAQSQKVTIGTIGNELELAELLASI
jgi:hypothetical protein